MIEAVGDKTPYLDDIMDSLYRLGDVAEELHARCPHEALVVSEGVRGVTIAARNYELALSDPGGSFNERRAASQALSKAITELRYRLHECYENAPEKTKDMFAMLLDETLHSIWDPHIQHDIETYTKEQIVRAFESLIAPISALDDYVKLIRRRVDDLSDNITILEARIEENGRTLYNLRRRVETGEGERQRTNLSDRFFIPVIMGSRRQHARASERKRPVLTVVK